MIVTPSRVKNAKLTTSPATTAYGRRFRGTRAGAAGGAVATAPSAVPPLPRSAAAPPPTSVPPGDRAGFPASWPLPVPPARNTTGSTGRMQGETAVISPPSRPIRIRVTMAHRLSRERAAVSAALTTYSARGDRRIGGGEAVEGTSSGAGGAHERVATSQPSPSPSRIRSSIGVLRSYGSTAGPSPPSAVVRSARKAGMR